MWKQKFSSTLIYLIKTWDFISCTHTHHYIKNPYSRRLKGDIPKVLVMIYFFPGSKQKSSEMNAWRESKGTQKENWVNPRTMPSKGMWCVLKRVPHKLPFRCHLKPWSRPLMGVICFRVSAFFSLFVLKYFRDFVRSSLEICP